MKRQGWKERGRWQRSHPASKAFLARQGTPPIPGHRTKQHHFSFPQGRHQPLASWCLEGSHVECVAPWNKKPSGDRHLANANGLQSVVLLTHCALSCIVLLWTADGQLGPYSSLCAPWKTEAIALSCTNQHCSIAVKSKQFAVIFLNIYTCLHIYSQKSTCIYVNMSKREYVWKYVCVLAFIYLNMFINVDTCIHTFIYEYMSLAMYLFWYLLNGLMNICINVQMHLCICKYVPMWICFFTMWTNICIYTRMYV